MIEADAGPDAFVRALVALGSQRGPIAPVGVPCRSRPVPGGSSPSADRRVSVARRSRSSWRGRDCTRSRRPCSSTATTSRPRSRSGSALPLEPNLRTAIDAVEHGRGDLAVGAADRPRGTELTVVGGIPNPAGWAQVRPGEVIRVVDRLGEQFEMVVADGVGSLQDLGGPPRGRLRDRAGARAGGRRARRRLRREPGRRLATAGVDRRRAVARAVDAAWSSS